ncbi:CBS domain-containing protein [Kitasatospora sp. RB6PN24]|uniref:CBS domain-containing protein n=1 Tax=Kitasatospora humi TaxID=2893891 RepID=UPI001E5EB667|nr:CBS domain-containing protein [Kitasatospora humi]MCC9306267.1 CBS domain-containing protein [Kitasatospora humi]
MDDSRLGDGAAAFAARGPAPHEAQVRSWMSPTAVAVTTDTDFATMIAAITATGRGILPVIRAGGGLVGVVSPSDLLAAYRAGRDGSGVNGTIRAEDLMSRPAVSVRDDQPIAEAAALLGRDRLHHLPVVDRDGRLVGLLSVHDLLEALRQDDDALCGEALRLALEPGSGVAPSSLLVRCERGHLTLGGRTRTRTDALRLVEEAGRINGVISVIDQLHWDFDDLDDLGDTGGTAADRPG